MHGALCAYFLVRYGRLVERNLFPCTLWHVRGELAPTIGQMLPVHSSIVYSNITCNREMRERKS
jgi:hypothetical protein